MVGATYENYNFLLLGKLRPSERLRALWHANGNFLAVDGNDRLPHHPGCGSVQISHPQGRKNKRF